jgi:hypothetical protein
MIGLLGFVLAVLTSPFRSRLRLEAENAALRHQLIDLAAEAAGSHSAHKPATYMRLRVSRGFFARLRETAKTLDVSARSGLTNAIVARLTLQNFEILQRSTIPKEEAEKIQSLYFKRSYSKNCCVVRRSSKSFVQKLQGPNREGPGRHRHYQSHDQNPDRRKQNW